MKKTELLKEFRALSKQAQTEKIADLQEELMNIRFKHATGQFEKTSEFVTLRKRIAQLKTIINEGSV